MPTRTFPREPVSRLCWFGEFAGTLPSHPRISLIAQRKHSRTFCSHGKLASNEYVNFYIPLLDSLSAMLLTLLGHHLLSSLCVRVCATSWCALCLEMRVKRIPSLSLLSLLLLSHDTELCTFFTFYTSFAQWKALPTLQAHNLSELFCKVARIKHTHTHTKQLI